MIGLVPVLGFLLFASAGVLGMRAFIHNQSLNCGFHSPTIATAGCGHYSYVPPVVLGVVGLLLLMGGGALGSYFAMRNVGLPLVAALRRRAARQ